MLNRRTFLKYTLASVIGVNVMVGKIQAPEIGLAKDIKLQGNIPPINVGHKYKYPLEMPTCFGMGGVPQFAKYINQWQGSFPNIGGDGTSIKRIPITEAALDKIDKVNTWVNEIPWKAGETKDIWDHRHPSDMPITSEATFQCEDSVLRKRYLLAAQYGFSIDAMHPVLAEILDPSSDFKHHLLLSVDMEGVDLILDNRTDKVKFWFNTEYKLLRKQDIGNRWLGILDGRNVGFSKGECRDV